MFPVSDWLGIEPLPVGEDGVVAVMFTPRVDRHEGAPGFLHGGVSATLLDEVMGALGHVLRDEATATATLSLRYRRPVPIDRPVRVEAWREGVEAGHRRRHRVRGRLVLADGTVAVEAHGIFVDMPDEMSKGLPWRHQ